jgi:putative transposase
VPDTPQPNDVKTAVGVDVGIEKLASLSSGETIANPRFYAQQSKRRNRLNRAASRKQKGSKRRSKAYERLARLERKIVNQRENYQWKVARKLTAFDMIVFEALNIKGMMKRCKPKWSEEQQRYVENGQSRKAGLNKAIADAAWYSLKQKVRVVAERWGCLVQEINPRHTSQECSQCGYISPTNRDKEKFLCEDCGYAADADIDAAVVILNRGLKELGIDKEAVSGVTRKQGKITPKESVEKQGIKSSTLVGEPGNLLEKPIQF